MLCELVINAVTGTDLSYGFELQDSRCELVIASRCRTHQQFDCCSNPYCSATGQMEWANMLHVRVTPRKARNVHQFWLNLFFCLVNLNINLFHTSQRTPINRQVLFLLEKKRLKWWVSCWTRCIQRIEETYCAVLFVVLNVAKVWDESLPPPLPSACQYSATGCWCSLLLLLYFLLHRDMLRVGFHSAPPSQLFCSTPRV